jgi:hypothetical protein
MDLSSEAAGAEAGRSDHTGTVERKTMSKTSEYVHHPCGRLMRVFIWILRLVVAYARQKQGADLERPVR